ncbi:MAG: transglycosylase domain-containing protein [Verrucomicrobia bacterium]|nr:transglycosylase domain-containing protein [Verrucomicrobiota bacterium]
MPLPTELQTPLLGTPTLVDIRGREIAELGSPPARVQIPLTLAEMGAWLPRVTVALEDRRFYHHSGFDWQATCGACLRNLQTGRIVGGGSTITQQLVKMACRRQQRNWLAKLYETIAACKLERVWTKERILTEYLNRCSFGNRRLGPEAASRAYFGKSARELTLAESVYIAGLSQAPTRFNPWRHPDRAERQYARSLILLNKSGLLSDAQRILLSETLPVVGHFYPPHLAPNYVDAIRQRRPEIAGKVRTTLDLDFQQMAELKMRAQLASLNRYDIADAAVVILDNASGAVRAMVGSSNYLNNQVNGATRPRSCGSTLKPFVYLVAIDRRLLTAATLLPDTADAIRDRYSDYDPQNFSHRYLGPVRVREALACSLNVPAIIALSKVGARSAFYELQKWGFVFRRSLEDYGAGFILGNAEIRLTDLAAAYAGLARDGLPTRPKLLASEFYPMTRAASAAATEIITDILCDNEARKKSFGTNSPLAFDERIAAKTGTSSGFRDAWTVGFDKEHTVAVWIGNSDGRPMRDAFAVQCAAPLWAAIMHELLLHDRPVPQPGQALVKREVCSATGLLPSRFSPGKIVELFLSGTEPAEDSSAWFSDTGNLLLPIEYAGWCSSRENAFDAMIRPEPRIISPRPDAVYQIDLVLPPKQQMIELLATIGSDVRWFIGDVPVPPQPDGRFFWQLTPGEWPLKAIGRNGTVEQKFTVR